MEERGGGRSKRKRRSSARRATKVAVTLYKASKPSERGPEEEKDEEIGPSGRCEGNGGRGVHEEEARMGGKEKMAGM